MHAKARIYIEKQGYSSKKEIKKQNYESFD